MEKTKTILIYTKWNQRKRRGKMRSKCMRVESVCVLLVCIKEGRLAAPSFIHHWLSCSG